MRTTSFSVEPIGAAKRDSRDRYGILVFSHLRWNFVWQRPQQFLSRFAAGHRILFVEEPYFDLPEGSEPKLTLETAMENVTVVATHFAPSFRNDSSLQIWLRKLTEDAIESVNGNGDFDRPLLWYYSPMDAAWSLGHFKSRGVVYDCMDELSQFKGAPEGLVRNEARLLAHADIVFTGGYELWLKKKRQHRNVHFFGCGVEYKHFARAQDSRAPVPADLQEIRDRGCPVLGWFGVVDERVNYPLLAQAAALRPDWSFVLVGPVVKVDSESLPKADNLHWMGGRDYKVLPDYCRGFDVCMMAFALNEATEFINPTKALEYLATGKPVLSTPVKDVVRQYSDLIAIAEDSGDFVDLAQRALEKPNQAQIKAGIEKARMSSWESTVAQMRLLIAAAVEERNVFESDHGVAGAPSGFQLSVARVNGA